METSGSGLVALGAGYVSMLQRYRPYPRRRIHSALYGYQLLCGATLIDDPDYSRWSRGYNRVKFWIENPWGQKIYNAGMVYDRHDFQVSCAHDGYYTLYFSNTFSWTVGKNVYLHYRVR